MKKKLHKPWKKAENIWKSSLLLHQSQADSQNIVTSSGIVRKFCWMISARLHLWVIDAKVTTESWFMVMRCQEQEKDIWNHWSLVHCWCWWLAFLLQGIRSSCPWRNMQATQHIVQAGKWRKILQYQLLLLWHHCTMYSDLVLQWQVTWQM